MSAPEPPFGAPGPAPRALGPVRREVTRGDLKALVSDLFPKGRWVREDQWEGLCPVHEDKQASFGIGLEENRKEPGEYFLAMSCQACGSGKLFAESACSAVGIKLADTFTYTPGRRRAAPASKGKGDKGKLEAVYLYTDEQGNGLYEVERWMGANGHKTFLQRRILPDGRKEYGVEGVRKVLLNLPAVRAAAADGKTVVYFAEGEKCVGALTRLGLTATCNSGGAAPVGMKGKFNEELAAQLAGVHELIVMPDNDDAGRAHAENVMRLARPHVGNVVLLDLAKFWPEIPTPKGDVADFLAAYPGIEGAAKLAEFVVAAKKPAAIEKAPVQGAAPLVEAQPVGAIEKPKRAALADELEESLKRSPDDDDWKRESSVPFLERLIWMKGKLKSGRQNILTTLRQHEYFRGRIVYDEFRNRLLWNPPPGWIASGAEREWEDVDTTEFIAWGERWLPGLPVDFHPTDVEQSVLAVGKDRKVHPLRDQLNALAWDGRRRLHAWLVRHCNAEMGRYSEMVGTAWMVSAVARVLEPGCQVDHMLVLRGGQGLRKTTLFRILAGGPTTGGYHASMEGHELKKPADARQKLIGNWIVEFAELESMNRLEIATVKAFLTETVDNFREPYAHAPRRFPRSAVFAGTINKRDFLKDDTGNRRFWIVECGDEGRFDRDKLEAERDQLWAEAVARFRAFTEARAAGDREKMLEYQWWLEEDDERLARAVQKHHLEAGTYDETIREWLEDDSRAPGSFLDVAEVHKPTGELMLTNEKVMAHALKLDPSRWPQAKDQTARALVACGWVRLQRRIDGTPRWRYVKAELPPVQAELVAPDAPGESKDDDLPY